MANVVKPGVITKTPGPTGPANSEGVYPGMRGHCYNGTGWQDCAFWDHAENRSRCMLFGGSGGVDKVASEALNCCDKLYGTDYEGRP